METTPRPQNPEELRDIVRVGSNPDMPTYHRPNGQMMSNYELGMIEEHQDLIRNNPQDERLRTRDMSIDQDIAENWMTALKAIDTPDDILKEIPSNFFYETDHPDADNELPDALQTWFAQNPDKFDAMQTLLASDTEPAHDPERSKQLVESLGFFAGKPIKVIRKSRNSIDEDTSIIEAYDGPDGPLYILETEVQTENGTQKIRVTTDAAKLLAFTASADKHMTSLRRKRPKGDSVAAHADVLYEEGARHRNDLRRSQKREATQGISRSARMAAWMSTRALEMSEKWQSRGRRGKIQTVGSAAVGLFVAGYASVRYGMPLMDGAPAQADSLGTIQPFDLGNPQDTLSDQLIVDTAAEVVETSTISETVDTTQAEARTYKVANGEGFTQLFDRLAVNRGYNLTPDQLYDIYQNIPNLDALDGTYRLSNGDLGIDSKTIRLNPEQMERFEDLLKKTKR